MLHVGARVKVAKDVATVRYVGKVEGQDGEWAGVEWDDPSRGKHDGSVNGVKYFACSSGLNAGSFVRVEKVAEGINVPQALLARYRNEKAEGGEEVTADELYVETIGQRRVKINLVGAEQISQLQSQTHKLTSSRLVQMDVASVGDADELAALLPNASELDLSSNLVSGWPFVRDLATFLPHLRVLILSDNRLALPNTPEGFGGAQLPGLRVLVLHRACVTWRQLLLLQACTPNLEELHACRNGIRRLGLELAALPTEDGAATAAADEGRALDATAAAAAVSGSGSAVSSSSLSAAFAALRVLNLEDNALTDWSEVLKLAYLPHLTKLHLSGNAVDNITYPETPTTTQAGGPPPLETAPPPTSAVAVAFPSLESLFLGGCAVSSWASINHLNCFPKLAELRLSGNPVIAQSKSGGRFEVVGRVANLRWLNGAEVKKKERYDSEVRPAARQYLKKQYGSRIIYCVCLAYRLMGCRQ